MDKVLVIVDVQKEFDDFIQHDLVDELHNYAENFNEVYQIWDSHKNDVAPTYTFPNQVDTIKKLFGKNHFSDEVKKFTEEIKDESFEGRTFKLSNNKGYIVRIDNNHDWFYVNPEITDLIHKLKDKHVILVGGADDECLEDIYQTFKAFDLYVQINKKYVYSAKTSQEDSINESTTRILRKIESTNSKYYNNITKKPTNFKYRFKTQQEFENEFGEKWRRLSFNYTWVPSMDIFLGENFDMDIENFNDKEQIHYDNQYIIIKSMVVENRPLSTLYKTKKIKRVLERKNSIDSASEIVIIINNVEELEKFMNYMKEYEMKHTVYADLSINPPSSDSYFPIYYFIEVDNSGGSLLPGQYINDNNINDNNYTKNNLFDGVYYDPFYVNDEDMIVVKKILRDKKIYNKPKPNYKPKKNNRIIESKVDEKVLYLKNRVKNKEHYFLYATTKEDCIKLENFIKRFYDKNDAWYNTSVDIFYNSSLLYGDYYLSFIIDFKFDKIYYGTDYFKKDIIEKYDDLFVKYPEEIYLLQKINFYPRLDYSPKKIVRTLENKILKLNEYHYTENTIEIAISNKDDSIDLLKTLNFNNYECESRTDDEFTLLDLYDNFYKISDKNDLYYLLYVNIKRKSYMITVNSDSLINLDNALFYPKNKIIINRELRITPTYIPKKINREL